jgi:hypothetical protein
MTEKEKREYFAFEAMCQKVLDNYYLSRGHKVDRSKSCKDFDCILDEKWKVEEKFRDREYNDILIEIVQDLKTFDAGWFIKTKCDYLHYIFMKDDSIIRFMRFKWNDFRNWYLENYLSVHSNHQSIVSKKGWGVTINLSVPIADIPKNLYFDDRPIADKRIM